MRSGKKKRRSCSESRRMAGQFTLGKDERIKGKQRASTVFSKGKTLKAYPILVKALIESTEEANRSSPLMVGFSVPKRNFKKAVDRNRIKRQLKEAYRLNCLKLKEKCGQHDVQLALFFIYTGKEKVPYQQLEGKIKVLLEKVDNTVFKS